MPRLARCLCAPGSLEPGRIYHVTNRGVDHCPIFDSDLDRTLFLSLLAEACLTTGATCHAWCLMGTHFHLVLEDPRGLLSQLMHHVQSIYARYFNDTRPRRRSGPLFGSRFRAELIDSDQYFEEACAYVLLNPVRTQVPLAATAEAYRWSSAALVCSGVTAPELVARLLEPLGGVEGVLATLPRTRHTTSRARRRARLEALTTGAWMAGELVLGGRTPEQYRQRLAVCTVPAPTRVAAPTTAPPAAGAGQVLAVAAARRFTGLALDAARDAVHDACAGLVPACVPTAAGLVTYTLWRFTSASLQELAAAIGSTGEAVAEAIRLVRQDRQREGAWQRLLWRLEWRLRWRLRAAPHRA